MGPLLMVAASLALVIMTALVKIAREELSGAEIVLWRGVLSAPVLLVLARGEGLRLRAPGAFALRLLFGFGAMVAFATAARGLSLLDLNLVGKLRPILIAVAAPLVLGRRERAGGPEWASVGLGFAGCALIVGPDLAVGSWYGVWALLAVALSSAAHISLRALGGTDRALPIVFWFHLGIAALALPTLLLARTGLRLPPARLWPVLVGVAAFATVGQLLMTRAYALDTAPTVAAATYVGPVWSLLGDMAVFGTVPSPAAVAGGALVVGASLWLVLARRQAATPSSE